MQTQESVLGLYILSLQHIVGPTNKKSIDQNDQLEDSKAGKAWMVYTSAVLRRKWPTDPRQDDQKQFSKV